MNENVQNFKMNHTVRENQGKKTQERRRNILYLILSYLKENKLDTTADYLEKEAHLTSNIEVCDNVDLDTILQEYCSYYFAKFGKQPKICKKSSVPDIPEQKKALRPASQSKPKTNPPEETKKTNESFEISIKALNKSETTIQTISHEYEASASFPFSLSDLNFNNYPGEWKEMFEIIIKEIIPKNLGIKWTDCIGMENITTILQEAIIYPITYPKLFTFVSPWKGILLYGPPGTGKTLIAKALACESKSILINVSASTFISKWRGESEKLVRCLFEIAKIASPCTVFIDEIDALGSRREEQQHEASRRFKSELLTQMDGILNTNSNILILATTNLPWEVDSAILRRFDKKILVNFPTKQARIALFNKYLNLESLNTDITSNHLEKFANQTENFSGSDIQLVCKNAYMSTIRKTIQKLKIKASVDDKILLPEVKDVAEAILNARPASICFKERYLQWKINFGGI